MSRRPPKGVIPSEDKHLRVQSIFRKLRKFSANRALDAHLPVGGLRERERVEGR